MEKLLLGLVLSFTLLLGACGNEDAEKKEDSKKSESVEKKKEAPKKEDKAKETEESKEDAEPATAIIPAHQEEEKDSEGLTQKDRDRIATEQAKEYGENNPEGEQSNEGKMGPGPDDPNYKPDPKFTDPGEGYDPVEGNKMPSADSYEFKQEPTEQERMEADARVAKEHGYTGIPNGDMGATEEMEAFLKERDAQEAKAEEEEELEWVEDEDGEMHLEGSL